MSCNEKWYQSLFSPDGDRPLDWGLWLLLLYWSVDRANPASSLLFNNNINIVREAFKYLVNAENIVKDSDFMDSDSEDSDPNDSDYKESDPKDSSQ